MAAPTLNYSPDRCKSCAAYDRVSLTLEWCAAARRPVLGEDVKCRKYTDVQPWRKWALRSGEPCDR